MSRPSDSQPGMTRRSLLALPAVLALAAIASSAAGPETPVASPTPTEDQDMSARDRKPGVGDPAPAFTLPGSDGKSHSLSDHLGKRVVVIAWFPKAFTGG